MVQRIPNPGESSLDLAAAASNCCSSSNHMRAEIEGQEVIDVVNQLSQVLPRLQDAMTRRRNPEVG
jgi:hypothetical protein